MGSAVCLSTRTNATSSNALSPSSTQVPVEMPERAWVSPLTTRVRAAARVSTPGRSSRRGCAAFESGSHRMLGQSNPRATAPTTA